MSWSHSKVGKPDEVIKSLEQPRSHRCVEPEEKFKTDALSLIEDVVGSYPSDKTVSVSAYGSQQVGGEGRVINSLSINITPGA